MKKKLEDYRIFENEYDYEAIVSDFWKSGYYTGKLHLIGSIWEWSDFKLSPKILIDTFEWKMKIEEYKGKTNENKN
jgi:hypothetical protein